jgi:hypothetical protein
MNSEEESNTSGLLIIPWKSLRSNTQSLMRFTNNIIDNGWTFNYTTPGEKDLKKAIAKIGDD